MKNKRNTVIAGAAALVLALVALDVWVTLAATGDPRCLFVRCVVVK